MTSVVTDANQHASVVVTDAGAALSTQHAYLAELQQKTRLERNEIVRLLRQRDELVERLRSLKEGELMSTQ